MLHPETAKINAGEHRHTDDVQHALRTRADELLAQVRDAHAAVQAASPCPFEAIAREIAIVQARVSHTLNEVVFPHHKDHPTGFPADMAHPHGKRIEDSFDHIIDTLHELIGDYRTAVIAGLFAHIEQAKASVQAERDAELAEAPDTTPAGQADPHQPRNESLQVAIPGVAQIIPAEVQECTDEGWQDGRQLLHLVISPEQAKSLGVRFVRMNSHEAKQLANAGYTAPTL